MKWSQYFGLVGVVIVAPHLNVITAIFMGLFTTVMIFYALRVSD